MAKLLLVRIVRNTIPGQPRMKYPDIYDAEEVERHRLGPIVYDGGLARGEDEEWALLCVRDELADKYVKADPRNFKVLSEEEAERWLADNPQLQRQPNETVDDPNRLLAIMAKRMAGLPLSDEDKRALDPDDPTPGIRRVPKKLHELFPVLRGGK